MFRSCKDDSETDGMHGGIYTGLVEPESGWWHVGHSMYAAQAGVGLMRRIRLSL